MFLEVMCEGRDYFKYNFQILPKWGDFKTGKKMRGEKRILNGKRGLFRQGM